jgi:hypothetical protein
MNSFFVSVQNAEKVVVQALPPPITQVQGIHFRGELSPLLSARFNQFDEFTDA